MVFIREFYQLLKDLTPILHKLFQKLEKTHPNAFYEASITLLWKPNKDIIKNTRLIIFRNIHTKSSKKKLANQIQPHTRILYTMTKRDLSQKYEAGWTRINRIKGKSTHSLLNRHRESTWQKSNTLQL